MVKNYLEEKNPKTPKLPSENTIQFLLNYSKSLHFIQTKCDESKVELNLN